MIVRDLIAVLQAVDLDGEIGLDENNIYVESSRPDAAGGIQIEIATIKIFDPIDE